MAQKVEIWRTGAGAYTDYSTWLTALDDHLTRKTHRVNDLQEFEFTLADGLASFQVPEAGNRVRVQTDNYANWFTGYLVNTPKREFLGRKIDSNNPIYGYRCRAASEELRLEWQTAAIFPTLPPFVNKYQGQIISELITILGGGLTTSNIDNGILIPYFRVRPEEGFMDVVRRLSDRTNMKFWTVAGAAWYKSFSDSAFAPDPDEADAQFDPGALDIEPVQNPVFNDVVGFGLVEPQAHVREYFVGDGFTGKFPLKFPLFGAESSKLLEDDFTGTAIDSNRWTETDPDGVISISSNSLRFNSGASSNNNRLTAKQGVEIAGVQELRAGRLKFGGASNAIVGGLFSSDTGLIAQCIAGFKCTPSGGQTRVTPICTGVVPANFLSQSEALNLSPWTTSSPNPTVTANNAAAPNGQTTAEKIDFAATGPGEFSMVRQTVSGLSPQQGDTFCFSVWMRADVSTSIVLTVRDTPITSQNDEVKTVTTEWQRFDVEVALGASPNTDIEVGIYNGPNSSARTIYVAWAQLNYGLTPAPYIATTTQGFAEPFFNTASGKTYQFMMTVNCSEAVRRRRAFFSLANSYGGEDVTANATVTFSVIELPDNESDRPTQVLKYSATISSIAQFLFYTILSGPGNGTDSVNITLNFCLLRKAVRAELWTRAFGASSWTQERLGDKADPLARAAILLGTEGHELTFFSDRLPDAKEKIKVVYRAAGQARARVRKDASVTDEIAKTGDSGVRAGFLPSVEPRPRDASEVERACQAYIDDHTNPLYEGVWKYDTISYPPSAEPVPGRFVTVTATTRHSAFSALVTEVVSTFINKPSGAAEIIEHEVRFGTISRLEQSLSELEPAEETLEGALDTLIDVERVEFNSVGTQFAADRPNADFTGTLTSSTLEIDAGAAPVGAYEVRKTDAGWGGSQTINKIGSEPITQTFTIPRAARDILAFIKNAQGAPRIVSRFASAIRVVYPLVPNAPTASVDSVVSQLKPVITLELPADATDVFGVEIRDDNDSTVLYQYEDAALAVSPDDPALKYVWDNSVSKLRTKTLYAYTYNLLGEYSSRLTISISMPAPGVPTSLDPAASGQGEFAFKWGAPSGATNAEKLAYDLRIASDSGFTANVESFEDLRGLAKTIHKPNVSRFWQVRAKDELGAGSYATYGSPTAVNSGLVDLGGDVTGDLDDVPNGGTYHRVRGDVQDGSGRIRSLRTSGGVSLDVDDSAKRAYDNILSSGEYKAEKYHDSPYRRNFTTARQGNTGDTGGTWFTVASFSITIPTGSSVFKGTLTVTYVAGGPVVEGDGRILIGSNASNEIQMRDPETQDAGTVTISGLSPGTHTVEVQGKTILGTAPSINVSFAHLEYQDVQKGNFV